MGSAVIYAGGLTLSNGASIGGTVYASAQSPNSISLSGAAAGSAPTIAALGSDANIYLTLAPKGSAGVSIPTGNLILGTGTIQAPAATIGGTVYASANSANFLSLSGNATGFGPTLGAVGADANIALNLAGKGTGGVVAGGGLGAWAKAPPAAQPARAVTLADVIAVLAGAGLTA